MLQTQIAEILRTICFIKNRSYYLVETTKIKESLLLKEIFLN